jgi:tetratricopeptide (TPR) repeat protein
MAIWAINGTGGVGKTWLALRWAHDHAQSFPDGQLYVDLRGFGPSGAAVDPAVAVRGFLNAFGVAAEQIPAGLAAQAALYRSVLAGKRVLVVLDNARDVDQVRPLLPGSAGCLVLVTSRDRLTGLIVADGAQALNLDLPAATEARDLLADRLGADRVAAEPDAVNEIVARCARLPLALAIAAARGSANPDFPLATLADELREAAGGLDAFEASDAATDVRTVFSWSYQALNTGAARLFRLLGLHPGPDITTPAAASLAGLPPDRVRRSLADLMHAHLLTEHTPGRYTVHDLLRAYAAEQAHTHDTDEQRRAAVHRSLDHYLHTGYTAALLMYPHRAPLHPVPPQPGVFPESLDSPNRALDWLIAEYPVFRAAIEQNAAAGFDGYTWQLAWAFTAFLQRHGRWHELAAVQQIALEAARRINDQVGQARAQIGLAFGCARSGRLDDADNYYGRALRIYTSLGDIFGQAYAHSGLIGLAVQQDRPADALRHAEESLDLYRIAGDRVWQANALNSVGECHALLGDHRQALFYCKQALGLLQELGSRDGEAYAWDSIGSAHRALADHEQAADCYQHAIDLFRGLGDRYLEASTFISLGDTHHAALTPDAARKAWEQALDILDEIEHPDASQVRAKLDTLEPATSQGAPGPAPATAEATTPTERATNLGSTLADHAGQQRGEYPTMTCVRHGQRWRIEYGHRTVLVAHSVGMLHLAVLLANPGQEIPAIELATGVAALHDAVASTPHQHVLDPTAIRDYRNRISHLREQIDKFEARNQPDRAAQVRAEHDWLVSELASATGISGRTRRFPDNTERARLAVSRAIRRTLRGIAHVDARIGEILENSIHTGIRCSYRPT